MSPVQMKTFANFIKMQSAFESVIFIYRSWG